MSAQIVVRPESETQFEVIVREGAGETRHRVTLSPAYARSLTGGGIAAEELLRRSFEFLLDREPKESILSRFDLEDIRRYFPEYERAMRAHAAS